MTLIILVAKTTRHLLLTWSPNKRHPVEVYEGLKLPQFTIERIHLTSCVDSSSSFYLGRSCTLP